MEILVKYGSATEYDGKLESPKTLQRKLQLPKTEPQKKRLYLLSVFIIGEGR